MFDAFSSSARYITDAAECASTAAKEAADRETKEENNNWKTNSSLLYDFVANHVLEWPTMTVDCLPGLFEHTVSDEKTDPSTDDNPDEPLSPRSGEIRKSCIIGTFTGGEEQNYLQVVDILLPRNDVEPHDRVYATHADHGGFRYGRPSRKFRVRVKLPVDYEPNRAIHMPQDPKLVVTVGPTGAVSLIDISQGNRRGTVSGKIARLHRHHEEGWGVAWNTVKSGCLATVADDMLTCVWDIGACIKTRPPDPESAISPIRVYGSHSRPIQDVAWKSGSQFILITVADDGKMFVIDTRQSSPVNSTQVNDSPVNAVAYCNSPDHLIATGGLEKDIALWDDRQLSYSVHRMNGHENAASRVAFNPLHPHFLASGSLDRRIIVWDLRKIGMEQRPEDSEDGPPELLFSHGGHTSTLNDLTWCGEAQYDMMVLSASDDNQLQAWTMNQNLFSESDDPFDNEKLIDSSDDFDVETDT